MARWRLIKNVKIGRCAVRIHHNPDAVAEQYTITTRGGPFRAKASYALSIAKARSIAARSARWLRNTRHC